MIHYHGTPLSGDASVQLTLARRHACVSYAAPGAVEIVAEVCQSFVLDNGAFSAWKSGRPMDITGFMDWAKVWLGHPACDWALIPDVIDGSEEENDSLLDTAENKHQWVPIWHLHESLGRLERLVTEWPRVAFGSSGQYATVGDQRWWGRMAEAMGAACDEEGRPWCKLHGLRMLDPTVYSHFPFSSADSTNVARNIGIDSAWSGPYSPKSRHTRALILMERIESHASASRWAMTGGSNHELFG